MPTGFYIRSEEQKQRLKAQGFKKGVTPKHKFLKGNTIRRGKKMTDEQRKRISEGHKGLIKSDEVRKKISDKQRGIPRPQTTGSRNPKWKGGISKKSEIIRASKQYDNWRRDIFIRDKFTCTECGTTNVYLEVHHIKSFADYPNLRLDKNNGKTVCVDCHCKIDKHRKRFKGKT